MSSSFINNFVTQSKLDSTHKNSSDDDDGYLASV
eukprot:CAMPEP_0194410368 /NCGR_PEP_ID=MMETSP0176-20130528/8421_1 /TAXON_ID=216777 /ORGANISM="Proboscia alata, Strain PI-D3" /LENGTH=33 /DNA_ID= /DNA_START= /DNA_END= /DNA_ORIENTATION=